MYYLKYRFTSRSMSVPVRVEEFTGISRLQFCDSIIVFLSCREVNRRKSERFQCVFLYFREKNFPLHVRYSRAGFSRILVDLAWQFDTLLRKIWIPLVSIFIAKWKDLFFHTRRYVVIIDNMYLILCWLIDNTFKYWYEWEVSGDENVSNSCKNTPTFCVKIDSKFYQLGFRDKEVTRTGFCRTKCQCKLCSTVGVHNCFVLKIAMRIL